MAANVPLRSHAAIGGGRRARQLVDVGEPGVAFHVHADCGPFAARPAARAAEPRLCRACTGSRKRSWPPRSRRGVRSASVGLLHRRPRSRSGHRTVASDRMSDWRAQVLKFWFGLDPKQWWKSDPELDHRIKQEFLKLWFEKRQLPAEDFLTDPLTALAGVVLFDQFPRNMFRGDAEQFATDPLALAIAKGAVDESFDDELQPKERGFLYMPFQHSENLADQDRSVLLFTALGDDYQLGYARKHHDVIASFGRFPHRNAILGRAPRPDEIAAGDVFPW